MANGKVLRQLIKAGATGDVAAFRRVSEVIIEEERQKQHHLLANDLEHILYGDHTIQVSRVPAAPQAPLDKEKGLPLLDIRQARRSLDEIVLPESTSAVLEEILEENRRADILRSYGMKAIGKVLFLGLRGVVKL